VSVIDTSNVDWQSNVLDRLKQNDVAKGTHAVMGPSIAVLPIEALGSNEDTQELADAVTDDITTALSCTPEFFVIAQNTSATYVAGGVDIQQVGAQLGVRYVVLGSLRQAGERLRANIELVQTSNAEQVWKERFDFSIDDLFATSDDVIEAICAQLQNPLQAHESSRAERQSPEDLDAWLLTQRARQVYFVNGNDAQHISAAEEFLELALTKDPEYVYALSFSANVKTMSVLFGYAKDAESDRNLALQRGRLAMELAPTDPTVLGCWANVVSFLEGPENAIGFYEAAIAGDANNPHHRANYGFNLYRIGRFDEAMQHLQKAFRLSPKDPRLYMWHFYMGSIARGTPAQAMEEFDKSIALFDRYLPAWQGKIIALARMELWDEAKAAAVAARQALPGVDKDNFWAGMKFGHRGDVRHYQKYVQILQEAFG